MIRRFARPYAQAFLARFDDDQEAQAVVAGLELFTLATRQVPPLLALAASPRVPLEKKQKAVAEVCESLGLTAEARRFLDLLLSHYRLAQLEAVVEAIRELLNRRMGVVKARVTSAQALDEGQERRLVSTLAELLDRKVELELAVDENLLAGFVALVGSYRYDVSLRGQLERLGRQLAQPQSVGAQG